MIDFDPFLKKPVHRDAVFYVGDLMLSGATEGESKEMLVNSSLIDNAAPAQRAVIAYLAGARAEEFVEETYIIRTMI